VLRRRTSRLVVVLESSYDQHNQAAVLRTADCLGIQHCWLVDPVEEKGAHKQAQGKRYSTRKAREKAEKRAAQDAAMRAQLGPGADDGSGAATAADAALGERARFSRRISKQSAEWLSIRHFPDTTSCVAALRAEGYTVWVTHLSQAAIPLTDARLQAPSSQDDSPSGVEDGVGSKLAVVFGREADGVSEEMVRAADELVYFPMDGFCESLNLSVSAALVLQHILRSFPALKYRRRSFDDGSGGTLDTLEGAMPDAERESLRRDWFLRLAKTPAQVEEYPRWASGDLPPPKPFDDLRRTEELRRANNMIPPKIRKRLAKIEVR
jgi:tRNA G18 (ribose-2'-O)-methylase SpoU